MRRWRAIAAGATVLALGAGMAIGGAGSATAATEGHWGTFTLSGSTRSYTGTVTLAGFPETTFTSTSRQSTVVSGTSTWQGPATPPGQAYGTSRGTTYLNQRPEVDRTTPSVTTYTFATPTPASGWSFVLGDIDADQATISAVPQGGTAATADEIGYRGSYNSCSTVSAGGWSCGPATADDPTPGSDVPTWDAATATLTGNASASDTAGATAWFSPTVPLTSLTITYRQRSGFPVYQTWFADATAALSGAVTLDGAAIPGATVTATAPRGTVTTTTTDASGRYTFPELPQIGGYTVRVDAPDNATGSPTATATLVGTDATADFAFASPPATAAVVGTVTDAAGTPVADVPVVITLPGDTTPIVDTTTNDAGVYTGSGLPPTTDVAVTVAGGDPTTVRTGAADAAPVQPPAIVAPVAVAVPVSGVVRLGGDVLPGDRVDLVDADGSVVATTTTDAAGGYSFTAERGAYTVRAATPAGSADLAPIPVDTTTGPATGIDFRFAAPTPPVPVAVALPGTVADTSGAPVADVVVTATPLDADAGVSVTATTGADGAFTLDGLQPTTAYSVAPAGGDPVVVTTPESGTAAAVALVVSTAAAPTPTPSATPTPAPTSTPTPSATVAPVPDDPGGASSASDGPLAFTGADVAPAAIAAGVLVLVGAGLLVARAVRNRRRSDLRD